MGRKSSINEVISLIERIEGKKLVKEGVDIDFDNLTVSYNPSHQKNVDTFVENSPTISNEYGNGIIVYSLLLRKDDSITE